MKIETHSKAKADMIQDMVVGGAYAPCRWGLFVNALTNAWNQAGPRSCEN